MSYYLYMKRYKDMKSKLPKKWTSEILEKSLKEIRTICNLKNAAFDRLRPEDQYPTNEQEADKFIKERIRIWLTNITAEVDRIEETL